MSVYLSLLCTLAGVFGVGVHRRDLDASVHRADIFQVRLQPLQLHHLILRHRRPSLHPSLASSEEYRFVIILLTTVFNIMTLLFNLFS